MIEGQRLTGTGSELVPNAPSIPRSFRGGLPTFQPSFRLLRGPVPSEFEAFYRANLRFRSGARLKSSEVTTFYAAWAVATGAPSLSARQVKSAMLNIGHRTLHSNGIYLCDVVLAADVDLADNFPAIPLPDQAHAAAIADRLDRMITELASIRAEVCAPNRH